MTSLAAASCAVLPTQINRFSGDAFEEGDCDWLAYLVELTFLQVKRLGLRLGLGWKHG